MATSNPVPAGYNSVQPYLIARNALAAINFYIRAFNAHKRLCMEDPVGSVRHAEIVIGDCCIMLGDERPEIDAYSPEHYGGSPISLLIYVADCDALYHQALTAGATSLREPADQSHGARMAGVRDPFGYTWYLATHLNRVAPDEPQDSLQTSAD